MLSHGVDKVKYLGCKRFRDARIKLYMYLLFAVMAQIASFPHKLEIPYRDDVIFPCQAVGDPAPVVTWRKGLVFISLTHHNHNHRRRRRRHRRRHHLRHHHHHYQRHHQLNFTSLWIRPLITIYIWYIHISVFIALKISPASFQCGQFLQNMHSA